MKRAVRRQVHWAAHSALLLASCAPRVGPAPQRPAQSARTAVVALESQPAQATAVDNDTLPQAIAAGPRGCWGEPQSGGGFELSRTEYPTDRTGAAAPFQDKLRPQLSKRWSVTIGQTTFRTTMVLVNGTLVIGTHGRSLSGKNEPDDGVYLIDAKLGTVSRFIASPGSGDRDVGAVAVDGERIVFGTDNGSVVAVDLQGKKLWQAKAEGKVRAAPALGQLNGDAVNDVVVGDEGGVLRALDGATGRELWHKGGGANEYGARGYIAAAAIGDLDGDGRDDVVAGSREGVLVAYRGRDGSELWHVSDSSGIHASPSLLDIDGDGRPEVLAAWSYGDIGIFAGDSGTARWKSRVHADDGAIDGLFSSPVPLAGNPGAFVMGTSWWGDKGDSVVAVGLDSTSYRAFLGRTSASAVVTDLDGDGAPDAVIGSERGILLDVDAQGQSAELARLGGPIEAPALLGDADGDGSYELFVASNDGKLTCFDTGSRKVPELSRFRGDDPRNRGELGRVCLGWHSAPVRALGAPGAIDTSYLDCCAALSLAALPAGSARKGLLDAAVVCNAAAASNQTRAEALILMRSAAAGAVLPNVCR